MMENPVRENVRLDKWLWAARFFKTRALAAVAIRSGKIELNGERTRPAKSVQAGDELRIRRGPYQYFVKVVGVSRHRAPAAKAASLYEETEDGIRARELVAEQLRAQAGQRRRFRGRPTKRARRDIIRFTRGSI
ncbi:MAG: RNA-binding protein [Gammaproteobacteria bacterium]|nr:RNA-binding protein [Gammaproteobacteria bacterium]MCI0591481.1 RNA-binding protein [Gammaproteobacteria bacterium]